MAKKEKIGVGLNPIEVQKVDEYNKIIYGDNNRMREHTINQIIHEYFEDSSLNDDFINLDAPIYVITTNFFEKGLTHRYLDDFDDISEDYLDKTYVIKKVPNNLDTFNKSSRTFCFKEPGRHRGLCVYHGHNLNNTKLDGNKLTKCVLLFDYYDESHGDYDKPHVTITRLNDVKNINHYIFNHPKFIDIKRNIFEDYKDDDLDGDKLTHQYSILEPIKEYTSTKQLDSMLGRHGSNELKESLANDGGALHLIDALDTDFLKDDD